jgi:DNA invertase Pin-like site-specific DNA recombinase
MKALVQGDVVVVVKLDRLARSTRDLLNIIHDLQQKGWFVSLGEAWCDTESDVGQLMVTVMTGIAQFERQLIRKRCEEGIARAKAMGKRFGRHPALDSGQRRKVAQLHAKGGNRARSRGGISGGRGHHNESAPIELPLAWLREGRW